MPKTPSERLREAATRLSRNMTLAQLSIQTRQPVALFRLQMNALESAFDQMREALHEASNDEPVEADPTVMGESMADLIARSLPPAPDTVPDDWKE